MKQPAARFSFLLLLLLLAGCGKATPAALPPEEIVRRAVARMKGLSGFHFLIERSGGPAYLDPGQVISFRRAEGDYVSPDRARATVRVITPGLVAEIKMISLEGRYWETDLLSGEWQELPAETGFNPAVLFDPQSGFQAILETDLQALELAGVEELDSLPGTQTYRLAARLAGERLFALSYGLIGPGEVSVQLWASPESFEIHRILITEPAPGDGEDTFWQIDFWGMNETIEISPPAIPE